MAGMGRVGFRGRTRRYAFLLVRARSCAGVDGATHAGDPHASFLADFLGNCAIVFPIRLLSYKNARSVTSGHNLHAVLAPRQPLTPDRLTASRLQREQ